MAISQQLLTDQNIKVVGFTGGKGRNYILNLIAMELANTGKKVVISNIGKDVLPPSGYIVYNKDEAKLLKQIKKEISSQPIIYAGKELNDYLITGINRTSISKLRTQKICDYIFLILGDEEKRTLFTKKEIASLSQMKFLDELIYCFQIDYIDQPLSANIVQNPDELLKRFPEYREKTVFTQELMVKYLLDEKNGALTLFKQQWPTYLIFTDITNVFLENRAINLSRDLLNSKIERIYRANLKDNMIVRISK
jgi:hypothetical protein